MQQPLVSILMPVYNGAQYLPQAIESILNQTYTNFEFIIINDGSTDNTENIILNYTDTRIVYIKNKNNIKLIATLNIGLKLANGKYIARMDADDISLPTRIQEQVKFMETNLDVGLVGSGMLLMPSNTNVIYPETDEDIRLRMVLTNPFAHPTIMLRKEVITKSELEFETQYLHAEDYAFWYKIGYYCNMYNLPLKLLKYREHPNQISTKHRYYQLQQENSIRTEIFADLLHCQKNEVNKLLLVFFSKDKCPKLNNIEFNELTEELIKLREKAKLINPYFTKTLQDFIKNRYWDFCCINTILGPTVMINYNKFYQYYGKLNLRIVTRYIFFVKCFFKL